MPGTDASGVVTSQTQPALAGVARRTAIIVADRDGTVIACHGDLHELTVHDPAGLVGQSLDAVVPPLYQKRHWAGFQRAIHTGQARAEGGGAQTPVLCGDGSVRRLPSRISLVRDAFGTVVAALTTLVESDDGDPPLYQL